MYKEKIRRRESSWDSFPCGKKKKTCSPRREIEMSMTLNEKRQSEWKKILEEKKLLFDATLSRNLYNTFCQTERLFFIQMIWFVFEYISITDIRRHIIEISIILWKRQFLSTANQFYRNYNKDTTPEWFYQGVKFDTIQYHRKSIEDSKLKLSNLPDYDEDYLEIMEYNRNAKSHNHHHKYKPDFKPYILESMVIPYRRSYECFDIRNRERIHQDLEFSNVDKVFDNAIEVIELRKKYGRFYYIVVKSLALFDLFGLLIIILIEFVFLCLHLLCSLMKLDVLYEKLFLS